MDPPATTREHLAKSGWTYTFLSDEKADVFRRYDLLHEGAVQDAISRPGEFLIDPTGAVRWVNLAESYYWVRTKLKTVLKVFDGLAGR